MRDTVTYSYQHGGASLMDFLNAQSDYRQVQLAYAQLIGAYLTAAGQLNLAVGREVIPMMNGSPEAFHNRCCSPVAACLLLCLRDARDKDQGDGAPPPAQVIAGPRHEPDHRRHRRCGQVSRSWPRARSRAGTS